MFRTRRFWQVDYRPKMTFHSRAECEELFNSCLNRARSDEMQTQQDRKELLRQMLQKCGSMSTDATSRELKRLMVAVGVSPEIHAYDLRSATTTDMKAAGIGHLLHRYLTGHAVNDIMNTYTPVDPRHEIGMYFTSIRPLLEAIVRRAQCLGLIET